MCMSTHLILCVDVMLYITMRNISYGILTYSEDTMHSGLYTTEAHMQLSGVQQFVK
jgi:hypothetical protein